MNIFHGLLFQGGHIVDPKLASMLGRDECRGEIGGESDTSRPAAGRHNTSRVRWLLEELVLLGGRPMATHRNDDIDEPFPTLHPCS